MSKKILSILLGLAWTLPTLASAAADQPGGGPPRVEHGVVNVRDIADQEKQGKLQKHKGMEMHEQDDELLPPLPASLPETRHFDNVIFHQAPLPGAAKALISSPFSPGPSNNFNGQGQTGWNPPDTNGAISPNNVLTTVNNTLTVRDRAGNQLTSEDLNNFWKPVQASDNSFDTRARYDAYGQRFIVISGGNLGNAADSRVLLAVSATSDPTGNWHLYNIKVDAGGHHWADYPTLGFNKNWVAIGADLFGVASGDNYTTGLWAISKSDLYGGVASPNIQFFTSPGTATQPAETFDSAQNDLFMLTQDSNSSVRLSRLTGSVGSASIQFVASVGAPSGGNWTGNLPGAPQSGTTQTIGPGINWMMDCVYRSGSIYGTQVVQPTSGATRTDIQWWKIGSSGTLQDFGRIDDPTGANYYGFGSIAVNKNGDALIGYTRYSASSFPSAGYSFRAASDPAGTFQSNYVYKSGASAFGQDRWGDYSHTTVDPSDDTSFWTVQEYSTSGGGWGTWWAQVPAGTTAATATPTPCAATAITAYLQVNGGSWQQALTSTVALGSTVNLGPQPVTGGTWSWTGPNGFTSTAREIDSIPLTAGANNFVATYTNDCGAKSTATFTITVTAPPTSTFTSTNSPTRTATPTNSFTSTVTRTPTSTNTPAPATATFTFTATNTPVTSWRIASGRSASYTDCQGNLWAADSNFTGGSTNGNSNAITKALPCTTDQALYQNERWGGSGFSYSFNVPAGSYQVTLKFAEIFDAAAGQRVQNISINGTQVLTNFEIFADAGGMNIADDKIFNNVSPNASGQIVVSFAATSSSSDQNAKVNALQVIPQPVTFTPTSTATRTSTPTRTVTPTNTASATNTPVPPTATSTPTWTPTNTSTFTWSSTFTNTATWTPTSSFTSTSTPTNTSTPTYTFSPSPTGTSTATWTATNTSTSTWTFTFTGTATATRTATPTSTSTATNTPVTGSTYRVASGRTTSYTDCQGNVWAADSNFSGGSTNGNSNTITKALPCTTDQALYQRERWGGSGFTYSFTVTPGSYQVTLKFAEIFDSPAGRRIQNISINGTQVLTNFDIYADAGGANIADDKTFTSISPNASGQIVVSFVTTSASPDKNAKVSALQIVPQTQMPAAPLQATNGHTSGSNGTDPSRAVAARPNISRDGTPVNFHVQLTQPAQVQLTLFTLLGEKVYGTSFLGQTGDNSVEWDLKNGVGQEVGSGLYVYVVQTTGPDGKPLTYTGKVVVFH